YGMDTWTKQVIDLLDALQIEKTDLVGNSFGGGLALRLAIEHPDRVNRIVLMGAMGIDFPITHGLDFVWGYTPSLENMGTAINLFVDNKALATDELIRLRYEASIEPGFQESFGSMFPQPRQDGVAWMASPQEDIRKIPHRTLIVHGREDQVIPLENSYRLLQLIDQAQLHVFGHCGHWTQIEQTDRFCRQVNDFLSE
ncbi:MAG: alpha/beta hydrolase, partial [Propionicimonas sp.]|nr:alpha/beta hydrolase [Propionicimonas sp.]